MTNSSSPNSVFNALVKVTKTFLDSKQIVCHDEISSIASIRVLSYQNDFEYLWGTAQSNDSRIINFLNNADQLSHIIIVWDDIPSKANSMVNLSNYLTPLDWAVWYTLRLHDNSKQPSIAQGPIISIFDAASDRFTQADSVRLINQFQNQSPSCMPGIKLFRATPCLANKHTIKDLIATTSSSATFTGNNSQVISDFDIVRKLWRSSFLTPTKLADHHAIANVIGPLLLLDDQIDDPLVMALRKLLIQLDLLPDSSSSEQLLKQDGPSWIDWESDEWSKKIDHLKKIDDRPINILLVDDAAIRHRWGEVIARALGLKYNCPKENIVIPQLVGQGTFKEMNANFYITESANGFLQSLDVLPENSGDIVKSKKFVLGCTCEGQQDQSTYEIMDLVFLDLRLFQGKRLTEKALFFKRIIGLAKHFNEDNNGDGISSWPGFNVEEINSIEKWINQVEINGDASDNDKECIQALTLLPRLISNLDFSLPIILFSSTGKRQIVETLRPYGNIITNFEKPRLQLGQDTCLTGELALKFKFALSKSFELIAARRLCGKLITASLNIPWEKYRAKIPPDPGKKTWQVQLMLDESGPKDEKQLTVGGLLAIYPPKQKPEDLSTEIFSKYGEMNKSKEYTRKNPKVISKEVMKICNKNNILIIPISLSGNTRTSYLGFEETSNLDDERVADNFHRQLVRCVSELAIYCIARQILPIGAEVKFSVMAGTRIMLPPDQNGMEFIKSLFNRWGIETKCLGRYKQIIDELRYLLDSNHNESNLYDNEIIDAAKTLCAVFDKHEIKSCFSNLNRTNSRLTGNDILSDKEKSELNTQYIRYFNTNDVRPIVEDIMSEYRDSNYHPSPDIVRAYRLNAFGAKDASRVHALHFLTDALVGKQYNLIVELKELLINGHYNKHFITFLKSHRDIMRGQKAQGLARIAKCPIQKNESDLAFTFIHEEHKNAALTLTEQEFIHLSQLLTLNMRSSHRQLHGCVYKKCHNGIEILCGAEKFFAFLYKYDNFEEGDEVTFIGMRSTQLGRFMAKNVKIHRKATPNQ